MALNQPATIRFRSEFATSLHNHWWLFLIDGIVLLLLGAAALIIPQIATVTVEMFFGCLFLLCGIIGLVTTFWMRPSPGFWWSLLSAIAAISVAAVLLSSLFSDAVFDALMPGPDVDDAVEPLMLVLTAFFCTEGIASVMFASDHKRELPRAWRVMFLSGIVDLVLASMIALEIPSSAASAIGLLVGINMAFGGLALIAMALESSTL
jgi:uncharacterized membrane protein HdeD (DUF308 family)